jgi:hypothetical protein
MLYKYIKNIKSSEMNRNIIMAYKKTRLLSEKKTKKF